MLIIFFITRVYFARNKMRMMCEYWNTGLLIQEDTLISHYGRYMYILYCEMSWFMKSVDWGGGGVLFSNICTKMCRWYISILIIDGLLIAYGWSISAILVCWWVQIHPYLKKKTPKWQSHGSYLENSSGTPLPNWTAKGGGTYFHLGGGGGGGQRQKRAL